MYVYAIMAESVEELQKALDPVHDEWILTVNAHKTKVEVFSRGKIRNKPVFRYGDSSLETVDSYMYIWVYFLTIMGNLH